jgi:hypothetical protein
MMYLEQDIILLNTNYNFQLCHKIAEISSGRLRLGVLLP